MNITKQRAFPTIPNKNICVSIGSILAVQLFYEKRNFCDIFCKHKSKGLDLNSLIIGLLSYKLTENFSIKEAVKADLLFPILASLLFPTFRSGVYTFIHKTISRGTFFVGPNEKLIMLASNSKKFNTK